MLKMHREGPESEGEMLYLHSCRVASKRPEDGFPWHGVLSLKCRVPRTCGNAHKPALPRSPVGKTNDSYRYGQHGEGV